jgi:hypothetical protein
MLVSNPLELYTVYLGWGEYDVIWQTCIQTGLAWVPFLGLFYENLTKPFESEIANGADTSFRRVFIEFFIMCLVIMFCVYPAVSLETKDVQYQPYCASNSSTSTVGNSGTTYDNTFHDMINQEVKVPLIYALVQNVASGFTNALATGSVPCQTNLRNVISTIDSAALPQALKDQANDFNNQCYLPAKAQFQSQQPDVSTYQETLKRAGGESDLNWMGSKVLNQLYYGNLTAINPVNGFPYGSFPNPAIDDAIKNGQMTTPQWGYPTCEQWWSDSSFGLEHKIAQAANEDNPQNSHAGNMPLSDEVDSWLSKYNLNFGSDLTSDDVISHGVLYDNASNTSGFNSTSNTVDTNEGISGAIAKPFVQLGQSFESISGTAFKRDALSDILPIVQAVLFFFVLLFMPLIHLFGRFRVGIIVSMSFILFGLIFMNYIWEILGYLENALIDSTSTPISLTQFGEHGTIENYLTLMYFAAPMLLMSLMSIAGIKVGMAFNQIMSGAQNQADSVARQGQYAVKEVDSLVTKMAALIK